MKIAGTLDGTNFHFVRTSFVRPLRPEKLDLHCKHATVGCRVHGYIPDFRFDTGPRFSCVATPLRAKLYGNFNSISRRRLPLPTLRTQSVFQARSTVRSKVLVVRRFQSCSKDWQGVLTKLSPYRRPKPYRTQKALITNPHILCYA